MPDPRIAVFLGAGTSCAEGAPTQAGLVNAYFKFNRSDKDPDGRRKVINAELATFFQTFFAIDVDHDNLKKIAFPTFEEALGTLALAISREETFAGSTFPLCLKMVPERCRNSGYTTKAPE